MLSWSLVPNKRSLPNNQMLIFIYHCGTRVSSSIVYIDDELLFILNVCDFVYSDVCHYKYWVWLSAECIQRWRSYGKMLFKTDWTWKGYSEVQNACVYDMLVTWSCVYKYQVNVLPDNKVMAMCFYKYLIFKGESECHSNNLYVNVDH